METSCKRKGRNECEYEYECNYECDYVFVTNACECAGNARPAKQLDSKPKADDRLQCNQIEGRGVESRSTREARVAKGSWDQDWTRRLQRCSTDRRKLVAN